MRVESMGRGGLSRRAGGRGTVLLACCLRTDYSACFSS